MTLVGLEFLKHQETRRHNLATESFSLQDLGARVDMANKDRRSREKIAAADRSVRYAIASLDASTRTAIAQADRQSREQISALDRLSKENISALDRAFQTEKYQDQIASQQTLAVMDRMHEARQNTLDRAEKAKDRMSKEEIASADRQSKEEIARKDRNFKYFDSISGTLTDLTKNMTNQMSKGAEVVAKLAPMF